MLLRGLFTVFALLFLGFGSVMAQSRDVLRLPYPVQRSYSEEPAYAAYDLPISVWDGKGMPAQRFEGNLRRQAFEIQLNSKSLLEMTAPLRDALQRQGFEIALDCEASQCGGFDFRFGTDVLPDPYMYVDMANYRFVAARRGGQAVSILASKSNHLGFLQVISIGKPDAVIVEYTAILPAFEVEAVALAPQQISQDITLQDDLVTDTTVLDIATVLSVGGAVVLEDLFFPSNQAELEKQDYASLLELAAWLAKDPRHQVMLVGHSDGTGPLAANMLVSKKRAEAVKTYLIKHYGVKTGQISVQSVGPLAPRTENASPEGRQRNRRVEAIGLIS